MAVDRPFVLYWSNLERFEQCNRKFLWYRGWKGFDLGRGDGKGKKIPVQSSEHHRLMGHVIQRVVEDFYNKSIWKTHQGKALRKKLEALCRYYFDVRMNKSYIEYGRLPFQPDSREELLETCLSGVRGYIKTMRHNRFLGVYSTAEVDLQTVLEHGVHIGGRADVIIRRRSDREINPGITILDGKNSKTKGTYTDPDQVRWYALCFFLNYGVMPDRVGFVYYRYPWGTPIEDGGPGEVETGVDWVDFTKADLEGIAYRSVQAIRQMEAHQFDPNPQPKICKFCDFETVCPERVAQKAANSKNRKKNSKLVADLKTAQVNAEGFYEL
jgi:hypothetical protein